MNQSKENKVDIKQLELLASYGLNNTQICEVFDISRMTLDRYCKANKSINEALKKGKAVADKKVLDSFFKRCIGFKTVETTYSRKKTGVDKNKNAKYEMVETRKVEKEFAPDAQACIFWLTNRMPEDWKHRVAEKVVDLGSQPEQKNIIEVKFV